MKPKMKRRKSWKIKSLKGVLKFHVLYLTSIYFLSLVLENPESLENTSFVEVFRGLKYQVKRSSFFTQPRPQCLKKDFGQLIINTYTFVILKNINFLQGGITSLIINPRKSRNPCKYWVCFTFCNFFNTFKYS